MQENRLIIMNGVLNLKTQMHTLRIMNISAFVAFFYFTAFTHGFINKDVCVFIYKS